MRPSLGESQQSSAGCPTWSFKDLNEEPQQRGKKCCASGCEHLVKAHRQAFGQLLEACWVTMVFTLPDNDTRGVVGGHQCTSCRSAKPDESFLHDLLYPPPSIYLRCLFLPDARLRLSSIRRRCFRSTLQRLTDCDGCLGSDRCISRPRKRKSSGLPGGKRA